jgi:hypothetical protein
MIRALLLVGSPRGRKSTSTSIGEHLMSVMRSKDCETETLWIREQLVSTDKTDKMIDCVDSADLIVLTAPLYDDCQPYIVTKTMEGIAARGSDLGGKRFMPIVNCGFGEHRQITAAAIPIYRMFAAKVGLTWAGSLAVAGGEMFRGSRGVSLEELGKASSGMRAKLAGIAGILSTGGACPDDVYTPFPEFLLKPFFGRLMLRMSNAGWKSRAKKNAGVVDARPYCSTTSKK